MSIYISNVNIRIKKIDHGVSANEIKLKLLSYKSIDLEASNRRNSLIFYGITEMV